MNISEKRFFSLIDSGSYDYVATKSFTVTHVNVANGPDGSLVDVVNTVKIPRGAEIRLCNARPEFCEIWRDGEYVISASYRQLSGNVKLAA